LLSLLGGRDAAAYRQDLAERALQRARSRYDITECSERFRRIYEYPLKPSFAPQVLAAR
jgi:hypothetical protein